MKIADWIDDICVFGGLSMFFAGAWIELGPGIALAATGLLLTLLGIRIATQ